MKLALAFFVCALAACAAAQELPDAPAQPAPSPFGKAAAPVAKSSAAVSVTENEAVSHVLTRPMQLYPAIASVNKIEGDVVVEAAIDTQGNVSSVKLVSGQPALAPSALAYVRQWIFRPFYNGDARVPVTTQITVHYSLFASQAEREAEKHFLDTYWPAWKAGEEALAKKDYDTAHQQYEIARDEALKLSQANWQELANADARLGAVAYRQKKYPEAEPFLLQALQLEQNHRDVNAPEVADALGNLGELYMAETQFGKAEPILTKAVELYDAVLQDPKALPLTLQSAKRHRVLNLFMLASLNQEMGAGDDAVKYCDLVVGDASRSLAKDDAILVVRSCETVYRKNLKFTRSHEAEKTAQELEGPPPAAPAATPPAPK